MTSLGLFLNNTDSDLKINTNYHNFNFLKKYFNETIILDINNKYSDDLKKKISNIKFIESKENSIKKKILEILDSIDHKKYDYISFINDDYIYIDNLIEYFNYFNIHNLDFCSYSDSSEKEYHFQLNLFTIKSNKIDIFKNYLNINKNIYQLHTIFEKKMVFLKIAYHFNNLKKDIFNNDNLLKKLIENKLISLFKIDKLLSYKLDLKNKFYNDIPLNFDLDIYKQNTDLKDFSDNKLYDHFINYGQYEIRKYSKNEYILPKNIREKLSKYNLLKYFDIPDDFDIYNFYKENDKLKKYNRKELLIHIIDNI